MSFSDLGLSSALLNSLEALKFTKPYPIQEQAIPAILKRKDVLGIAETGSGKTASYVLPILMHLGDLKPVKNRHVNILTLVPTRELAVQVADVFHQFSKALPYPLKTLAVFGGVSVNTQMQALQNVNILVATPGRLLELVDANAVHLSSIETLVLDEADKMLNVGFRDEMNRIIGLLPKKRQNLLFSATLTDDVKEINSLLLYKPLIIKVQEEKNTIDLIKQVAYFVDAEKKGPLLRYLISKDGLEQVLIFTSSVKRADNVATKLRANGIDAMSIHSKKTQGVRNDLITKFKHRKLRVLVATDLLSRGIDIEFLPFVINYELPRSPKDYIHRIGRTGRAENPGEAISLITPEDEQHFKVIQKKMGKWVNRIDAANLDFE